MSMRLALILAHAYSRVVLGRATRQACNRPQGTTRSYKWVQGTYKAPKKTYKAPTRHLQVATRSEPAAETQTWNPSKGRSGLRMRGCGPLAGAAEGPLPAQPARRRPGARAQSCGARGEPLASGPAHAPCATAAPRVGMVCRLPRGQVAAVRQGRPARRGLRGSSSNASARPGPSLPAQ